jgi:hypothetical protein
METKGEHQGETGEDNPAGTTVDHDQDIVTVNVLVPEQSTLGIMKHKVQQALPEGIRVQFLEANQKYALEVDELIYKLTAHSSEFDIFYIRSDQEFARNIIEKGFYVDLLQNDKISAFYDAMYSQIQKWCTYNNQMFGFPALVRPYAHLTAQENSLKQLGYSIDDLRTFSDVFRFSKEWEDKFQETGVYWSPSETIATILRSYLLSHYDYDKMYIEVDNQNFRDFLEGLKDIRRNQDWVDVDNVDNLYFDYFSVEIFIGNIFPVYVYKTHGFNEMAPASMPLLDQETDGRRAIDASFYIINPFSKHIDEALEAMVQIGEISKHADVRELLYKDMAFYSSGESTGVYGTPLNALYKEQRMYDRMGKYWQQHELYYAFPGMNDLLGICDEYLKDAVSLDEAIEKMEHIIDIVRRESLK